MLPQHMCYHGNQMSNVPQNSFFVEKIIRKLILAIICFNFTFSTIFLVKNSHIAIKVHVNKV